MLNSIFDSLLSSLGPDKVCRAPSVLLASITDASLLPGGEPLAVVYPSTHADVVTLVRLALAQGCVIVPRGAGTGTTGGAVSILNSIVVDFSRMNRIVEVDVANRVAVVEPGVITGDLQTAVEAVGLFYPPDPASLARCTLGGNVAENAGGPRAYKYGVTGTYVVGLTGVWGTGESFSLGGKLLKNVTGYDLIRLLVGSEGTLGLVTEITLKLIPKPTHVVDFAVGFNSMTEALSILSGLAGAGVYPAVSEWMDQICLEAGAVYLGQEPLSVEVCLLFQLDGFSESDVLGQLERLQRLCVANGGVVVAVDLWELRRCLSYALRAWARHKASQDIVIPPASIGTYLAQLKALSQETGYTILGYGHLGDGNIHVNILNRTKSDEAWGVDLPEVTRRVFELALAMGGTLTGEHGIGLTKRPYLGMAIEASSLGVMQGIKQVCDPHGVLNIGKGV